MPQQTITLEVFRYRPEEDEQSIFQSYEAPYHEHWVVLDALNWIKDNVDGTLSYRWSCRMGVCGSCGMMLNGDPKLSCAAFLKDYFPKAIRVEPLANFPVERDLVIVMDGFMEKLQSVKPWIIRDDTDQTDEEYRQTPFQLTAFKQFSMCINCMLCYSACPELAGDPDFLGPAAIALAHRYNLDSRDNGTKERQDIIGSEEGVWGCAFVGECTEVCPKNVNPAGAIQQAKVAATNAWYKRVLLPWGKR
jgi:fumarate reductase iron-sulfur subunit